MSYDWINILVSIALVALTAVLAFYTRTLAIEAKKSRRAETDPNVIVTAVHDEDRPSLVMLVTRNIGKGLAKDIRIKSSVPLVFAFGIDDKEKNPQKPVDRGPFISGIPSLGPGEHRTMNWGQPGGLSQFLGKESIVFTCDFFSQDGRKHTNDCKVDVESFMMTNASESVPLRTAKALETIADNSSKALTKSWNSE